MSAMEPPFNSLAHVSEQMPAVSDLTGLWRAEVHASGVFGRAVPGDGGDAGVPLEPTGQGRGRTIWQQVDDPTAIQVDRDRPVAAALSKRPIVDTDVDRT